MIEFNSSKKRLFKKTLFNPYKNGFSTYDLAYLSSKRVFNDKTASKLGVYQKNYLAA